MKILYFLLEIPASPRDHVELVIHPCFIIAVVKCVATSCDQRNTIDLKEEWWEWEVGRMLVK